MSDKGVLPLSQAAYDTHSTQLAEAADSPLWIMSHYQYNYENGRWPDRRIPGNYRGRPLYSVNTPSPRADRAEEAAMAAQGAPGLRVVRGPDWEWGDQDGGEGFVGTVVGLEEGGSVIVQWDMGQKCRYRCGRDNKFDLRVFDSGPSGS